MIFNKLKTKAIKHDWDLGFILNAGENDYRRSKWNVTYVKHSFCDRWFADPFILEINELDIILLCEEFMYSTRKGRLAKLIIDRKTLIIKDFKIILDLPTHLSYPAYFRKEDEIFIYPENSEDGKLTLYKYSLVDDKIKEVKVLSNEPLTDATIISIGDAFYMFSTISTEEHGNGNILHIFKSASIDGSYEKYQRIELMDNTARGAGSFFVDGIKLIRPAQNCNNGYGKGVVFQEVVFTDGKFEINEICRQAPPLKYKGMHTFNKYGNVVVLDFYYLRHPILNKCFWFFRNLVKK